MADVVFLVVIVAFFGLTSLFVSACEHIVGPSDVDAVAVGERVEEAKS